MFNEQTPIRISLERELLKRISQNARYSQRAFAQALGMSAGELSEVIQGKRVLSRRSALKISQAFRLSAEELRSLLVRIQIEKSPELASPAPATSDRKLIDLEVFAMVSDWKCFAILNLMETEDFSWSNARIASRLAITPAEARNAIDKLVSARILARGKKGALELVENNVLATSNDIPSAAIRLYHREMLHKAIESLELHGVQERELMSVGIPMNPGDMAEAKEEIRHFSNQFIRKFSKGRKREVYQLQVAFIPITKPSSKSPRSK